MECCPRLGGPPCFPDLPTRLAPYVAHRETFECYRCERGRSLRVLRSVCMAISTPRDCPQHGPRTCVVSFERRIGRYRCRWVCISAPLRDFDILDCAGDDTVRSSGSGFQPPPRSSGSGFQPPPRGANDRPPQVSSLMRRRPSRSRSPVVQILESPPPDGLTYSPIAPRRVSSPMDTLILPDDESSMNNEESGPLPDAQPASPISEVVASTLILPDNESSASSPVPRRLLRRYTSDTLVQDLARMQRRAIDFPDAAALAVMQNIVQGHFEEAPRAEPELYTDSMMETVPAF